MISHVIFANTILNFFFDHREIANNFLETKLRLFSNSNPVYFRLLSSFIDRSLDDIDYTIGDKLFLENLFDMEIREPPPGKDM